MNAWLSKSASVEARTSSRIVAYWSFRSRRGTGIGSFGMRPRRIPDGLSHQSAVRQLALPPRVNDGREDDARHMERAIVQDDREQDLPRRRVDLRANDARVHEVIELVDADQEDEGADRDPRPDAEREDHDDAVRDQVADDREEPDEERDDDERAGERQPVSGERQDAEEVDGGQGGVDRGDLDLREDDRLERRREARDALGERGRERPVVVRPVMPEEDEEADEDPHDRVEEEAAEVPAGRLQGRRVLAQPCREGVLQVGSVADGVEAGREREAAETLARLVESLGHLLVESRQVSRVPVEEAADQEDERDDEPARGDRDEDERDDLRDAVRHARAVHPVRRPRKEGEDEEPCDDRRHEG